MAVVNTWNDAWVKLPKEGFIDKKRRVRRVWRCIPSRKSDIAIAYAHTVITPSERCTDTSANDNTLKLNQLDINCDSVADDSDLVEKMSTLSCNQNNQPTNTDWDKKLDELAAGWKMIMSDYMVDQIDGKISNLNISHGNEKNNELTVNPFR